MLLASIENMQYAVTIDVLHTVCNLSLSCKIIISVVTFASDYSPPRHHFTPLIYVVFGYSHVSGLHIIGELNLHNSLYLRIGVRV